MEKEDIKIDDIHRILFGEAPEIFLVEVLGRTLLIYFFLLITVRLMGKRMSGQLTISEMAVMVMLGAIVSPAMQIPNVGLLQGALILLTTLLLYRCWNYLEFRSRRLEKMSHGTSSLLVKDGVLVLSELKKAKLSRQQLFTVLRNSGIYNLGQVERVYLEAFGMFSVYQFAEARPGLPLFPPDDQAVSDSAGESDDQLKVCASCGAVVETAKAEAVCEKCQGRDWGSTFTIN
jgi:uncharacterized membrane protein YcaP (DUF421 family)